MVTSKIDRNRRVLGWAIAIAVLFVSAVAVAAPPIIPATERRFDHGQHDASSKAGGKAAVCADCHKMDAKGVRVIAGGEHPRCVKCHSFPKTCNEVKAFAGTPKNPGRLCDTCHKQTGACPMNLPAKPSGPTYQARFAHGEHVGFKVAIEAECMKCHAEQAPAGTPVVPAHPLCFRCHSDASGISKKLLSNNCTGCHQPPKGKTVSNDPFRLPQFDHKKHHADSKMGANFSGICSQCHDQKKIATATDVPRPSMSSCLTGCHDGQKAFSAVGTQCTRCHKGGGGSGAGLTVNGAQAFSHAKHIGRNVKIDAACSNCHGIKQDGSSEAMAPLHTEDPAASRNHMPCAASGCHQTEFLSRSVKICTVCHDKADPWTKAVARMQPKQGPVKTEFFENMNHVSHLQKKGTANAACSDCHGDKLGGGAAPKGHAPCAECHGKGPPAHPMTECDKCHGKSAPNRAPVSEWSVAASFNHKAHAIDPRGARKSTNCVECHADIGKAKTLADVAKPKMQTCDGCHNGKLSFKTTGFECSRCHTGAKQPSTPNAQRGFTGKGDEQAMLDQPTRGDLR